VNFFPQQKTDSLLKFLEYYSGDTAQMDLVKKADLEKACKDLAVSYLSMGEPALAEKFLQKEFEMAKELDLTGDIVHASYELSRLYETIGKYEIALKYYDYYTDASLKVYAETKEKEVLRGQLKYDFEKKEAALKSRQDKINALAGAERKKQKQVIMLVSAALIIAFILAAIILNSLRVTNRQKKLIELKRLETEKQKATIEEKNRDIMDSINYAKRIQQSLLPTEKYISRKLAK
jgi:tetratricopeptide (TPR) repeat protein